MNGSNNNQHGGGLQQPPIAIPSGASLADYSRNGDPSSVLSQRQQQQNSSSINNLANNELLSLALSGDLSKALQAANLSLPQQHQQQVGANNALPGSIMQQLQTLLNMASGSGSQQAPTPQDNVQTNSRNPDPSVASLNSPSMHNSVTSGSSGSEPKPRNLTPDIVPCRARGMPSDHNFQSAFFRIPGNLRHGDGLVCSYPACRNRGIRFLYCSYCRDAVAKRNFRNKHSHESIKQGDGEDPVMMKTNSEVKTNPAVPTSSSSQGSSPNSESSGSTSSSSGSVNEQVESHKRPLSEIEGVFPRGSELDSKVAKFGPERQTAWTNLLSRRPEDDDEDEMSRWLMQVMAVSDLKQPLHNVDATLFCASYAPVSSNGEANDSTTSNGDTNESTESTNQSDTSSSKSNSEDSPYDFSTEDTSKQPSCNSSGEE